MEKSKLFRYLFILFFLTLIFHLSPFSGVEYPIKCFNRNYVISNPVGVQVTPFCEKHIYGKTYQTPIFPLKEKTNERIEFCKNNVEIVERSCNFSVDEVVIEDHHQFFDDYFKCKYLFTSKYGEIVDIIAITKFSEDYISSRLNNGENISSIEVFAQDKKCKNLESLISN